jgi:protein SCO1
MQDFLPTGVHVLHELLQEDPRSARAHHRDDKFACDAPARKSAFQHTMSATPTDPTPSESTGKQPQDGGSGSAFNARSLLVLVVVVVIAGGVALLAIGGNSSGKPAGTGGAGRSAFQAEALLTPAKNAPPLALRNYLGQPVNLRQYRGKAVLVTFLYTNCPDVCPLIASNLRVAQNLMGPKTSSKVQIIAVSVDPKGDTPKAVASFLARHGMTGRMQYLVGNAHELAHVWKAWAVGSERDVTQPQFVNHSGVIYGITASGVQTTVYLAAFKPSAIAHDVPLLASE